MVSLFDITTINGMTISNRFVRSATWEGMANEDGTVTPQLIDLMVHLAKGGVGLLITGLAAVRQDGQTSFRNMGIYRDDQLPGLTQMTNAIHQAGGKVAIQLVHGGVHSNPQLTGTQPMGPSIMSTDQGPICRAMTKKDIDAIIMGFQVAAIRAQQAGFDAIQLHGAHGFLMSQFLSPFYNHRSDRYGGTVPNRARFVLEVYQAVREAVGTQYPIMIKMNATDFQDTGVTTDDVLQTAQLFQDVGMDNIELSGGTAWASRILRDLDRYCVRTVHEEAYYRDVAKRYKADITVPLVLTGGIRTYETAQHIVEQGIADYIGLSRPLIREPALVNRWKSGDTRRSSCVSDNACFKPALEGKGIQCVHLKK